jgi:hypothetical protein
MASFFCSEGADSSPARSPIAPQPGSSRTHDTLESRCAALDAVGASIRITEWLEIAP